MSDYEDMRRLIRRIRDIRMDVTADTNAGLTMAGKIVGKLDQSQSERIFSHIFSRMDRDQTEEMITFALRLGATLLWWCEEIAEQRVARAIEEQALGPVSSSNSLPSTIDHVPAVK